MDHFVEQVERRLAEALGSTAADGGGQVVLLDAARHLCLADRAKRARPRFVHRLGAALGVDEEALVDVAVAAEMMHAASLLHDDVIDEGTTRRGLETVNARWSNTVAVLGGDMLLCLALGCLDDYARTVTSEAIDTVARMTTAVMEEVACREEAAPPSLQTWRRIAQGKTGVLLGWCGRAVARLAGASDRVADGLAEVGVRLGVAFQLADDLLDFAPQATAKTGLADLRNGNPSHPVIRACEADPALARRVTALRTVSSPTDAAVQAVAARIVAGGTITAGLAELRDEVRAVRAELAGLGPAADEIAGWAADVVWRVERAFDLEEQHA